MKTEYSIGLHHSIIGAIKGKKIVFAVLLSIIFHWQSAAQEPKVVLVTDSILPVHLEEVIVISSYNKALEHKSHHKPLSTLDEYLESSKKVNMIKRGAYAWEPVLNDMSSERLSVTIDGMLIFGACTDKMDPRMPGMGNHSSPNNEDLIFDTSSDTYMGKLSLTMTGYWKINLKLENEVGEVLKGEDITEENESSSLFFELEF